MFLKKITAVSIAFAAMTLSLNAIADGPSLRIVNNTTHVSTIEIKIHDGQNEIPLCSTQFGALKNDGALPPQSYTDITNGQLNLVCENKTACPLDIYSTKDCTGPVIGKVIINVAAGIQKWSTTQEGINSGYSINVVNPFYLEINSST